MTYKKRQVSLLKEHIGRAMELLACNRTLSSIAYFFANANFAYTIDFFRMICYNVQGPPEEDYDE